MRSILIAAALPAAVVACGGNEARYQHYARQGPSASSASSGSASGSTSAASSVANPAATLSVSLASVNPTAVPLESIVAIGTAVPTPTVTTPAAGTTPTHLPGAPGLPDLSSFKAANYPQADVIPPTDSEEVKQWKKEVEESGIDIPDIAPTVTGGCLGNPEAMADKSRCWWTCGGCTGEDDVSECPDKLTWGLTYDDGPSAYTPNLLDYLDDQKLKATFFIIGSRALYQPATLQREHLEGHQISVHTWSHHLLTEMTNDQIIAELGWSKKIIKDITGVTPNTFRPPQGDIDNRVRAIAKAMKLTPVMWTRISPTATFDTDDFAVNAGTVTPNQVLHNWKNILGNATAMNTGFIVLEHDLWPQCVEIATGYILPDALAHEPKFNIQPVITCHKKEMTEAYIELASDSDDDNSGSSGSSSSSGSGSGSGSTKPSSTKSSSSAASSGTSSPDNSNAGFRSAPGVFAVALGFLGALLAF